LAISTSRAYEAEQRQSKRAHGMGEDKLQGLAPEFALASACCRWPPSKARNEAVIEAAAGVDWPLFLRVAKRHRIEGLAWQALRQAEIVLPCDVVNVMATSAAHIAKRNLGAIAESIRLQHLFEQAAISLLFVKGVTLGVLAYGTSSLKMSWDIDLLIAPEQLGDAAELLEGAGYVIVTPPLSGRTSLRTWHLHSKESVWRNREQDVHVELHTALVDNGTLLRGVGVTSPCQEVEIARAKFLPTLRRDELFAYLAVHGASSGWFRLKWIADFNALLSALDPAELEYFHDRSEKLGARRAVIQALLLCAFLFDAQFSPDLAKKLEADRVGRWLFRAALRKLAGRSLAVELHEVRAGTLSIHLMQLWLSRGWVFKVCEIRRQLASPLDRVATPLPRALHFLYPLLLARRFLGRKALNPFTSELPRARVELENPG
jgi:hypothetical protein